MIEFAVIVPAYNEEDNIDQTLLSLSFQQGVDPENSALIVVDNNSTDRTADAVRESMNYFRHAFAHRHVITEAQKGTGAAADTGFRFAIEELGASVLARVDADTITMPDWAGSIQKKFKKRPNTALLTGPVGAWGDGNPHALDSLILPPVKCISKVVKTIQYRSFGMLRFAPGHNMATTAEVYEEVGGFSRVAFGEKSDDVEYSLKVAKEFGLKTMRYERHMQVFTSQRRLRAMGYIGALGFYFSDNTSRRIRLTKGNEDYR